MTSPALLFVTYYRLAPTGQIGVFKRCVRLMPHLLDDFAVHLVNYGPLPDTDLGFAAVRDSITIHELPELSLGDELTDLLGRLRPAAVVLGETPLRGNMRLSHRAARHAGVWQVAMENYYAPRASRHLAQMIGGVDRWLLLGLTEHPTAGVRVGRTEIVPPLVRLPADPAPAHRRRVCIMGYDKQTLHDGIDLLAHLPPDVAVDILTAPAWSALLERRSDALGDRRVDVAMLPDDDTIFRSIRRASVVFGKAGFQQVVEAVLLGARVVCRAAGGGLEPFLVPDWLQPHVAWLDGSEHLVKVADQVSRWLEEPAVERWLRWVETRPDTTRLAAERLKALVEEAP